MILDFTYYHPVGKELPYVGLSYPLYGFLSSNM